MTRVLYWIGAVIIFTFGLFLGNLMIVFLGLPIALFIVLIMTVIGVVTTVRSRKSKVTEVLY